MKLLSQLKCAIHRLAQRLLNTESQEASHLIPAEQRDIGVHIETIRLPSGRTIMLLSKIEDDD